jgi:hypothetical protein
VGALLVHGVHVLDAWHPSGHSTEHVVCVKQPDLEAMFGPSPGQIRIWAKRQSQSPPNALQNLFRVHDH